MGINTPKVVSVEPSKAPMTSLVPFKAASYLLMPSSNFRAILSVTTIELSTKRPMAKAKAEMVRILRVRSAKYMAAKLAAMDTGMEVATTNEILHPPIKIRMTAITTIKALVADCDRLLMESSMLRPSSESTWMLTPGGIMSFSSFKLSFTAFTTSKVLASELF